MRGQLQVRQGTQAVVTGGVHVTGDDLRWLRWGEWTDVQSPGWLVGFVLPHDNMVYEFRYAPQEADNG